ncbi:MAG TPA: hypothetical protein VGQ15_04580 [Gaiellaceae bacterium]|jgi:hypothetical protein|nr:hypothetical protein [Gaiellaceae bacterium]
MSSSTNDRRLVKGAATAAIVAGLAAGSYGIANAASGGSGSSSSSGTTTSSTTQPAQPPQGGPPGGQPWGHQRSDETLLTGDTASKVREAALAEVSGGTIVRVETDADGHAKYEAHMTKADGTPVTVYVDENFDVVSVETR